jgi:hypothetical protein
MNALLYECYKHHTHKLRSVIQVCIVKKNVTRELFAQSKVAHILILAS